MSVRKALAVSLAVFLFLFALVSGCGKDAGRQTTLKSGAIMSKWGKPHKGVRAMLYTPGSDWKEGQDIEVRLKLKNSGNTSFNFDNPYKSLYIAHNGEVFAEPIGEETVNPVTVIIKPGETVDIRIPSIATDKKFGKGAGVYSIGGSYGLPLPELKVPVK